MDSWTRRDFLQASALAGAAWMGWNGTPGQQSTWAQQPLPVERRIAPVATADERIRQPDLWVMEVFIKPLRLIKAPVADPKTGEVTERLVWYLCYRAINRPVEVKAAPNALPASDQALAKKTLVFVPEFLLVTDDNAQQKRYIDRVMPSAQEAINKRERLKYKNSVEVVGAVPPVVPEGKSAGEHQILGVATWRGIDPSADRFKVYLTGFSNGYEVKPGAAGQEVVLRKTLALEYWRPGDEFEQSEQEIRFVGEPEWIYR